MDWKDALTALRDEIPLMKEESEEKPSEVIESDKGKMQSKKLNVVVEKKGRGGKIATIIEGFEIEDDLISEIAKKLKQKLGIGGSARGGEILLQGNCRDKVIIILKEMGFKA